LLPINEDILGSASVEPKDARSGCLLPASVVRFRASTVEAFQNEALGDARGLAKGHQEVVSAIVGSDVAVLVTIERYTVRIRCAAKESAEELRVTQVFAAKAMAGSLCTVTATLW
jgi:hypothetical protein